MNKIALRLALAMMALIVIPAAHGQILPKMEAAYCLNGSTWLPLNTLEVSPSLRFGPPQLPPVGLYFYNTSSTKWIAAPCDSSGNLQVSATSIRGVTIPTLATGYLYYNGSAFAWQSPSGSGTVNSGTAYSPAYYTGTGTTVGGITPINGLLQYSTSAAPSAATSHYLSLPANCVQGNTSTTAYICTTSPSVTPAAGDHIQFEALYANTGSSTLAVNGATAATIKKWGGSGNLIANDLLANHWINATFDGTYWQIEGQLGNANATQINGTTITGFLGSGSVLLLATNNYGCLDGYDHLPCVVYHMGLTSQSSVSGSYSTAFTTTSAGLYRIMGNVYATTNSSTSYTVTLQVKESQTGGVTSHGLGVGQATIGSSDSWNVGTYVLQNLATSTAIQWETTGSGTNTNGVWNIDLEVERVQ